MRNRSIFSSSARRRDPVPRVLSGAALAVSIVALVFSMSGLAPAVDKGSGKKAARKQQAALNKRLNKLKLVCPITGAIDMGSYCLEGSTYKVPTEFAGQNDYVWATQKCVQEGGWLPSSAELLGAA